MQGPPAFTQVHADARPTLAYNFMGPPPSPIILRYGDYCPPYHFMVLWGRLFTSTGAYRIIGQCRVYRPSIPLCSRTALPICAKRPRPISPVPSMSSCWVGNYSGAYPDVFCRRLCSVTVPSYRGVVAGWSWLSTIADRKYRLSSL